MMATQTSPVKRGNNWGILVVFLIGIAIVGFLSYFSSEKDVGNQKEANQENKDIVIKNGITLKETELIPGVRQKFNPSSGKNFDYQFGESSAHCLFITGHYRIKGNKKMQTDTLKVDKKGILFPKGREYEHFWIKNTCDDPVQFFFNYSEK